MSIDNLSAKIVKFSEDYSHFCSQMESRVASLCKQKTFTGEYYTDDYINTIDDTDVVVNRATGSATANEDIGFTRGRLGCQTLTWSTYKAEKDVAEMFKDPTAETVKEMIAVMNRKRDVIAVTAMLGTADRYNQTTGLWDAVALPVAQQITSTGGLTLDALRATAILMDDAEVPEENRYIVGTASHIAKLLEDPEVISSDYNTVRTLVNGTIDSYMGFKFVKFAKVGTSAVAFQSDKVLFGENMSRAIRIAEDPAHNFDYAIRIEEQVGALRREDAGVVEIAIV